MMVKYRDRWKASKDALAREEETSLRLTAHRQRVFAKLKVFGSRVSNPGSRSKPDLDQLVMKKIAKVMRLGSRVALTGRMPSPVAKASTSSPIKKRKKTAPRNYQKRLIRQATQRIQRVDEGSGSASRYRAWFPAWDHASPLVKAMAYGMAIPEEKRFAFSLKLSGEVVAKGLSSKMGFAGFMQDRLARYLRKAVGPGHAVNFVFVVEAWRKWEQAHIQGAIELDDFLPFGDHGAAIGGALGGAGGVLQGKAKGTQLNVSLLYEAAGWFDYLGKRRMVTAATLAQLRKKAGVPARTVKEGLIGATVGLRQDGKRWFATSRASEEYVLRDRRRT